MHGRENRDWAAYRQGARKDPEGIGKEELGLQLGQSREKNWGAAEVIEGVRISRQKSNEGIDSLGDQHQWCGRGAEVLLHPGRSCVLGGERGEASSIILSPRHLQGHEEGDGTLTCEPTGVRPSLTGKFGAGQRIYEKL